MDFELIKELIIVLPILFFSVILHECGHGIVAYKCGDPTAKMLGRITLNPIPHIDLFGTIIVPLVTTLFGNAPFGWAKPVPVNFYNLRHPRRDMILVTLGGVGANILLAIIGIIILLMIVHLPIQFNHNFISVVVNLFVFLIQINVILAVFNLIPIPPLDGSRIVLAILPSPYAEQYAKLETFGIIIVFALAYLGAFSGIFALVHKLLVIMFAVLFSG
ncbi:MAG: site-2 protease family protein [bacterium]